MSMDKLLLGIDVGTSGTKTVLCAGDGTLLSSKTVDYPLSQPQNGWAEQDPEDWWQAVLKGIRCVLKKSGEDPRRIAAVGLTGQMHGLIMLDRDGAVLRPAILWCDQRTERECRRMEELAGRERILEITGSPAMTGFTASKILWVKEHEPALYARCAHILLPKDYIRYRLTGEFATDVSDASGMQLLDIRTRRWSKELLSIFDIDASLLPALYESAQESGRVSRKAADETGLVPGAIVAGGAADNAAAAVSAGVVKEGKAFTTIGSSAVIYAISDHVRVDPKGRVHGLCAAAPGKWSVMSCTQAAGLSLKWLRDTCCAPETEQAQREGVDVYTLMDRLAEKIPIGAGNLIYLPYLMGERSPHPDPHCRGVFFGLSAMHTRAHLIRAVMEGVAFSQLSCLDVLRELELPVGEMTVCGGGAKSLLWRGMLTDLYGCPTDISLSDQGAAWGAALLAAVSAGLYQSVEQAVAATARPGHSLSPDRARHARYLPYYQLYLKLYDQLGGSFKALAGIEE
ncbi:xylulokinase [Provencibacterium massiliense]|uniref:xylulokinase n=1 Tax=Provencibacterium massiliense TaxID=1841868 RepID=UPI00269D44AE